MNRLILENSGFPFDMQTLQELQGGTLPFIESISKMFPNRCRLWGVVLPNTIPGEITDGMIYWDGEMLPFKGGSMHLQFSIMQETIERGFNTGTPNDPEIEDHPAYIRRWAQIGNIAGAESVHFIASLRPVPKFLTFYRRGSVYLGNIPPLMSDLGGLTVEVDFNENIQTTNYMVLGSFSTSTVVEADLSFVIKQRTATGFKIQLNNVYTAIPGVSLNWLVLPLDNNWIASFP